MSGEAMKPFSRKCINKEVRLSCPFLKKQKKAKLGNYRRFLKVAFCILIFRRKFGLFKHNDNNIYIYSLRLAGGSHS